MSKVIEFVVEHGFVVLHTLLTVLLGAGWALSANRRRMDLRDMDAFVDMTIKNRVKFDDAPTTSCVQDNLCSCGSADYPSGGETALDPEKQGISEDDGVPFSGDEKPGSDKACSPFVEGWPIKDGTIKNGCQCECCDSGRKASLLLAAIQSSVPADGYAELACKLKVPRIAMQITMANAGCPCEKCAALRVRLNDRRIELAGFYDKFKQSEYARTGILGQAGDGRVLVKLLGGPMADKQVWVNPPKPGTGMSFMVGSEIGQLSVYTMSCDHDGNCDTEMMFLGFEGQPIVNEFMKEKGMPIV